MDTVRRYYFYTLSLLPFLQILFQKTIGISFIIFYSAFGSILIIAYLISGTKFRFPKFIIPLLLLVLYYFIWDLITGDVASFKSGFFSYLYHNQWLHTISILILIYNTRFDPTFIKSIIVILKVTIVISFFISLFQFVVNPFFLMTSETKLEYLLRSQYEIRLFSIFGYLGGKELGISFVSIISILIGYYLYKGTKLKLVLLLMAGFVFFATNYRYVYVSFFIIILQYPIVNGFQLSKIFRYFGIIFLTLIAFTLIADSIGYNLEEYVQERLLSKSASTRLLAIDLFFDFFPKNPFFGSGLHVSEDLERAIGGRSSQMHVGYLSHLYEYGLIGSLLLFYFLYQVITSFYKLAKSKQYYGSLFAIIAFLVTNLTQVSFSIFHYGLLFAFIFHQHIKAYPEWKE